MQSRTWVAIVAVALLAVTACSSSKRSSSAPTAVTTTTAVAPHNVVQAAAYQADLSTFATVLNVARSVPTLSGRGPFTVFAPSNAAFARLPHQRLAALLSGQSTDLARMLKFYVVPGKLLTSQLHAGTLKTLDGATLHLIRRDAGWEIQDTHGNHAKIVRADIITPNGVVDVIDSVLFPPT